MRLTGFRLAEGAGRRVAEHAGQASLSLGGDLDLDALDRP